MAMASQGQLLTADAAFVTEAASALAAGTLAAGIDEAGRGCLAGPVVAAAVMLPPGHNIAGLADSKLLSAARRAALAPRIKAAATAWGLGVVWPRRIDEINILQATFEAMSRAAATMRSAPRLLLIDGNRPLPAPVLARYWPWAALPLPAQRAIVGGDRSEAAISAASIVAKTFRDALMIRLSRRFPGYGLEIHKGYGTRAHFAALRRLGPCPLHRFSFRGVAGTPPEGRPPRQMSLC